MKHHKTKPMMVLGLLITMALSGGCAGPEADAPFTLLIRSEDVVLRAVHRMTIEIDPEPLRFAVTDLEEFMTGGGNVQTHVSAVGEWVLTADAEWIQANANPSPEIGNFEIEVPVWTEDMEGDEVDVPSPPITVRFYRNDVLISNDSDITGFFMYPAPPGNSLLLRVNCRIPEHMDACRNEDAI